MVSWWQNSALIQQNAVSLIQVLTDGRWFLSSQLESWYMMCLSSHSCLIEWEVLNQKVCICLLNGYIPL